MHACTGSRGGSSRQRLRVNYKTLDVFVGNRQNTLISGPNNTQISQQIVQQYPIIRNCQMRVCACMRMRARVGLYVFCAFYHIVLRN